MTKQIILVSALLGLGLASAPVEATAQPLKRGEITNLFPGQFEAKVKGYRVNFSGTRGGRLKGQAYGQQDTGRWYLQGSSLCVESKKWTKGEARCGTISRQGGWYVANSSAGEELKFRRTDVASAE